MNGIDKIAGRITEDGKQEAEAILAEARKEAGGLTEKYAVQAKEEAEKILAAAKSHAEEIKRRAVGAAEQDAKQQLLATKQDMITKAFDEALKKLLNLPEPEYVDLLARLAVAASSTGSEEIIFSAKDQKACGQKVMDKANQLLKAAGKKGGLTIHAEPRPFEGGLLLKAGDVEVNCTLDTILRLSKEDLTLEVAGILFN
jgi:V/A-type H+-transporting ATPase subunit E